MPGGNYAAYFNKAGSFVKKGMSAAKGKATSSAVKSTVTGASSGARSFAKNNKMARYVVDHPGRAGAIGLGAASLGGYAMKGRRGRGTDKFTGGRPTGMYGR